MAIQIEWKLMEIEAELKARFGAIAPKNALLDRLNLYHFGPFWPRSSSDKYRLDLLY
jgi:hypothetical protein